MKRLLPAFLLSIIVANAQIDRPVTPEDLADQQTAAQAKHKDEMKVLTDTEKHLKALVGTDYGNDPKKQAPLIQVEIMKCLSNGDYSRKEAALYLSAASTAGRLAQELEAKSKNPAISTATVSTSDLTQQLDEIARRAAELRAKPTLTGVERTELDGLESLLKQLRETLVIVERIRSTTDDLSKSTFAAQQMRDKEQFFRFKAREAGAHTTVYNVQCEANRTILAALAERDDRQQQLDSWGALYDPALTAQPNSKSNNPGDVPTPSPALLEVERLTNEMKELKKTLSDPDALQRQLDHLKTLSSQTGSK